MMQKLSQEGTACRYCRPVLSVIIALTFSCASPFLNVCKFFQIAIEIKFSDSYDHGLESFIFHSKQKMALQQLFVAKSPEEPEKTLLFSTHHGNQTSKKFQLMLRIHRSAPRFSWNCNSFNSMTLNLQSEGERLCHATRKPQTEKKMLFSVLFFFFHQEVALGQSISIRSKFEFIHTMFSLGLKKLVFPDSLSISSCRACRLTQHTEKSNTSLIHSKKMRED